MAVLVVFKRRPMGLTLLAVWQIWNDSNNIFARGGLARVAHNQKLHDTVIHRPVISSVQASNQISKTVSFI